RFLGVADSDDPETSLESWQLYEIDRQSDPAALAQLEESIRATIVDAQAAVDDWMAMRDSVRALAAGLADTTPLPADEITEARALLEWMEANHFVFLGYRRYRLVRGASEDRLVRAGRSVLGFLRQGHRGRRYRTLHLRC